MSLRAAVSVITAIVLVALGLACVSPFARAAPSTRIVGGSAAQQAVLRQILAGLGSTRIPELRVVRASGGVKLQAAVQELRPTWEVLVVGGAFFDRSAALRLPRLLEVDVHDAGWPTSNAGGRRPPPATASSVTATRSTMRRLAFVSGARVAELSVSTPDALAVALRLQVKDAANYLHHRLRALVLQARANAPRYEGLYIEVDDARGAAWTMADARFGGSGHVRPSLRGCDPFPSPGPGPGQLPPCPE